MKDRQEDESEGKEEGGDRQVLRVRPSDGWTGGVDLRRNK